MTIPALSFRVINCEMTEPPFKPPQKPKFPKVKLPSKFFCLLRPYRCHLNNKIAVGTQFPRDHVSGTR